MLYEDKHVIVVNKPPGVLSQAAASTSSSKNEGGDENDMLSLVRGYLIAAAGKPPDKPVYLGLVHRLDRNVGGAMVFAKRSKAAARLGEAFREHKVKKVYVAVVLGDARKGDGGKDGEEQQQQQRTLRHVLAFEKGGGKNVTRVVGEAEASASGGGGGVDNDQGQGKGKGFVVGELRYAPLLVIPHPRLPHEKETLLRVELISGRKHQIRGQLSYVGHPIIGDVKYGAPVGLRDRSIALHCRTLAFEHPRRGGEEEGGDSQQQQKQEGEEGQQRGGEKGRRGKVMEFHAPLPPAWRARFGDAVVAAVEGMR